MKLTVPKFCETTTERRVALLIEEKHYYAIITGKTDKDSNNFRRDGIVKVGKEKLHVPWKLICDDSE